MNKQLSTLVALAALSLATPALAVNDLAPANEAKMKIKSAQLGIKSPPSNVCPAQATVSGWIFTTKPGTVQYMLVRKGGSVSGPFSVQSKKAASGYMAQFSRSLNIVSSIDAEYRIAVSNSNGVVSNWAPLKANCTIGLGGNGELQGG
ncbi:MAG: hypothetical protein AAFY99_14735 [Pseudomonadota bacterium]